MGKIRIYCDIDGVLADIGHRMHYIDEKNYDGFYGCEMADDEPIKGGIVFLETLIKGITTYYWHAEEMLDLVFITGRPERSRTLTKMWLSANFEVPFEYRILMRKDGDYRKSPEVKKELILGDMNPGGTEVSMVYFIDDDPSNCEEVEPAVRGWGAETAIICFGTDRYDRIKSKP